MNKKEELEKSVKEGIDAFAKEIPRAIIIFFILIICIILYLIYKWKFLFVPIGICITYYLIGFIFLLVFQWAVKKAKNKIKNNDDLDF